MTRQQQVVIVGGGVIGLLTAYNLASEVRSVVLLDRSNVGQESSWAGGGIVSPLYPWRYSPAVTALAHWSQDFYPQLGERLFADTGVDPEVHTTGLYWLDLEDETEALAWAERENRPLRAVDISAVHDAVPVLGGGFARAIYMADVANVQSTAGEVAESGVAGAAERDDSRAMRSQRVCSRRRASDWRRDVQGPDPRRADRADGRGMER
jgi:glycine oxidase